MTWQSKKASSEKTWLLDETPTGNEELYLFENPELLTSPKDTRDVLENFDYHQDINGKRSFKSFAFCLGWTWGMFLIVIVVLQGFSITAFEVEEFIAVVTTTTASVFGLSYVVGRYLFGSKAYDSKTAAADSVAPN